jgi:hypothetical protein
MRLVNGEWKSATRVTRNLADGKRETLHTQVQPEYPKENDGSVDWK